MRIYRSVWLLTCTTFALLALLVGVAIWPVALFVVLSSPWLVRRYYRWLDSAPRPSTGQFEVAMAAAAWASPGYVPVGPSSPLALLTEEQLCQRWRTSCVELEAEPSTIGRLGVVEDRRLLLEEIERRNPAGFLLWITSDAPRSATLMTHLTAVHTPHDQLDWDALLR